MKTYKLKDRIISFITAVVMVITILPLQPITAHAAEGDVAAVTVNGSTTNYTSITDAVTAVVNHAETDNAVLTLLDNIDLGDSYLDIMEPGVFTLDLNGFEIKSTGDSTETLTLRNEGLNVTIKDSSAGQTGKITGIDSGIFSAAGKFNLTGGTVSGEWAINDNSGNGTISGGTVIAGYVGIFGSTGTVISGGTISAPTDIYTYGDTVSLTVGENGTGATFPGGIKIEYDYNFVSLPDILADGTGFWCGGTMQYIDSVCTEIADKDITVKTACTHRGAEITYTYSDVDYHYQVYSCCNMAIPDYHEFEDTGYCTECGSECEHYDYERDGTCDRCFITGLVASRRDGAVGHTHYYTTLEAAFAVNSGDGDIIGLYKNYTLNQSLTLPQNTVLRLNMGGVLTFGEGVTLTNNDTIVLPDTTAYADIPTAIKGGTVKIGEKTYIYDSENNKWVCDETGHTGGTATCTEKAVCTVCSTAYGRLDSHSFGTDNICTVCGIIGGYCGADTNEGGVESLMWTLADGTLTISGNGAMADYDGFENNYAPWYSHRADITKLVVNSGVTTIGDWAFSGLNKVQEAVLPSGIITIGQWAFADCTAMAECRIPETVTSIGEAAFIYCDVLQEVTIPYGVTVIEANTFFGCDALDIITIPAGVTTISHNAFTYCTTLTAINVDAANTAYKSVDGVLFTKDGTTLVKYPEGKTATEYTIPSTVQTIGNLAFFEADNLEKVIIPDSVESIGKEAFAQCNSLKEILIPASVTEIGNIAFSQCTALTEITFRSSDITIGGNAFIFCNALNTVNVPCDWIEITYTFADTVTMNYVHSWADGVCTLCGEVCEHDATFTYSSEANAITAACSVCEKAVGTATVTAEGGQYNGEEYAATVSATGTLADGTYTVTYTGDSYNSTTAPTAAGAYTASVTVGGVTASVQFTISKITLTADDFTFTPPENPVYNGEEQQASVTTDKTGTGEITVHYYNSDGEETAPVDAGTYTVKIDVTEGENYSAVNGLTANHWTFAIEKTDPVFTAPQAIEGLAYTGQPQVLVTPGTSDHGTFIYRITGGEESSELPTGTEVYTYIISWYLQGDKNHHNSITYYLSAAISKADQTPLTITGIPDTVTYGDTFTLSATGGDGTNVLWWEVTSGTRNATVDQQGNVTVIGAGDFTVTVINNGDSHYNQASVSHTFTSQPKQLTDAVVSVAGGSVYNGELQTPAVTVTLDGVTLTENTDYTLVYNNNLIASTQATVTVTGMGNYDGTVTEEFIIEKATPPQITFPTVLNNIVYKQEIGNAELSYYNNEYGTFNWAAPDGIVLATGDYALDFYPDALALQNYDWASDSRWIADRNALCTTALVTVDKATPEYTAPEAIEPLVYNGQPQILITAGAVDNDECQWLYSLDGMTWSTDLPTATNANTDGYTVYYKLDGGENYVSIDAETLTVIIEKAEQETLEITGVPADIKYGDVYQLSTTGGSGDGAVTYASYDIVTAIDENGIVTIEYLGTSTIYVTKAESANYKEITAEVDIEAKRKPLTVADILVANRTYNGTADATIQSITLDSVLATDDVSATGVAQFADKNADVNKPVYVTDITLTGNDAFKYILVNDAYQTYATITPAPITVIPLNGQGKTFGEADPVIEYYISGAQLYDGDRLTGALGRESGETAGEYAYTLGTLSNANYNIQLAPTDNFTIHKALPALTGVTATIPANSTAITDAVFTGASVPGEYTDFFPLELVWGDNEVQFIFTPDDSLNYAQHIGTATVTVTDTIAPIGLIRVELNSWTELLNNITFDLFFNKTVDVYIYGDDELSGVKSVEYTESAIQLTAADFAAADWKPVQNSKVSVTAEDAKQFIYYARITDNAGNVTVISSNGMVFDLTPPVITGIADGADIYVTTAFDVTDDNAVSVTVNGAPVTEYLLQGNTDYSYVIKATDAAGNKTTITVIAHSVVELNPINEIPMDKVTADDSARLDEMEAFINAIDTTSATDDEKYGLQSMKGNIDILREIIESIAEIIEKNESNLENITEDNVASDCELMLEDIISDSNALLDSDNLTDAQRTQIQQQLEKAQKLMDKIDASKAALDEATDSVPDVDTDNVTADDAEDIAAAKEKLEDIVNSDNYTSDEKATAREQLEKIKELEKVVEETATSVNKAVAEEGYADKTEADITFDEKDEIEANVEAIEELLGTDNLTEEQREALEDTKTEAEKLLAEIKENSEALDNALEAEEGTTADNYQLSDKEDLKEAVENLKTVTDESNKNYTAEEKQAAQTEIDRIEAIIADIEETEKVIADIADATEKVDAITDAKVIPDSEEAVDAVTAAQAAYNNLTDRQKELVGDTLKQNISDALAKITAYEIIHGADGKWTKGSSKTLGFTANGLFKLFKEVRVDGVVITRDVDYTAMSGSTIVTLNKSFLDTLSVGKHKLEVVYDVIGEEHIADCEFTIKAKPAPATQATPAPTDNVPKTGDNTNTFGWMALMLSSMAALAVALKKKKEYEDR